jgi:hypothetical protein
MAGLLRLADRLMRWASGGICSVQDDLSSVEQVELVEQVEQDEQDGQVAQRRAAL